MRYPNQLVERDEQLPDVPEEDLRIQLRLVDFEELVPAYRVALLLEPFGHLHLTLAKLGQFFYFGLAHLFDLLEHVLLRLHFNLLL